MKEKYCNDRADGDGGGSSGRGAIKTSSRQKPTNINGEMFGADTMTSDPTLNIYNGPESRGHKSPQSWVPQFWPKDTRAARRVVTSWTGFI